MKLNIRRLAVGALSGAVGTAAMDLPLYRRYRHEGGQDSAWRSESAEGVSTWDEAPAPGQLVEKMGRLVTRRPPPDRWARPTTNLVHWATGAGWGLQYAALAARPPKHPVMRALALAPVAWLAGYVLLPLTGVYKPIWEYDARAPRPGPVRPPAVRRDDERRLRRTHPLRLILARRNHDRRLRRHPLVGVAPRRPARRPPRRIAGHASRRPDCRTGRRHRPAGPRHDQHRAHRYATYDIDGGQQLLASRGGFDEDIFTAS